MTAPGRRRSLAGRRADPWSLLAAHLSCLSFWRCAVGLDRKRLLAYAAIAIVVLAVGARYLLAQHGGSAAQGMVLTPASRPATPTAGGAGGTAGAGAAASAQPSAAPDVVVDICGAVVHPGVYHLAAGARVCDLVQAAGGVTGRAELSAVNLAAKLADGQQVIVPKHGQPTPAVPPAGVAGGGTSSAAAGPVNLNLATAEQLDALPGVGPATAQKIIDYRTTNGGFRSVEDLKNVSGIGDAKFEALKDLVSV
jgi:competence protein ComEA